MIKCIIITLSISYRFKIFRNNLEMINKHNNDPTITYKMGLN